jgi:hypothetical protein
MDDAEDLTDRFINTHNETSGRGDAIPVRPPNHAKAPHENAQKTTQIDDEYELKLSKTAFFPRSNSYTCTLEVINNSSRPVSVILERVREPGGVQILSDDLLSKTRTLQDLIFDFTVVLLEKFYRLDRIHEALRVPEHSGGRAISAFARARYKFRMCLLLWLNRNPRENIKFERSSNWLA